MPLRQGEAISSQAGRIASEPGNVAQGFALRRYDADFAPEAVSQTISANIRDMKCERAPDSGRM
ncbi:MAG: hypothetical protein D6755_04195 [Anaerolineae bacterium]|nr:MAG: hypothetical protein D6755_04195 [Anaerolineae bacterium]